MPDIGYAPTREPDIAIRPRRSAGRAILTAAITIGVALAVLATPAAEAARAVQAAGPELTTLLRAMAGLKLLFAAPLVAAAYWRLAAPSPPWRLAAYAASCAAMAAGPVLIWNMAHIRLGAFLLHGGLLTSLLVLWRDPSVSARLEAMIAKRRATLRA